MTPAVETKSFTFIYHGFSVPSFKESSWKWWPIIQIIQPSLREVLVLCIFKTSIVCHGKSPFLIGKPSINGPFCLLCI